jgi:hypothetical protein
VPLLHVDDAEGVGRVGERRVKLGCVLKLGDGVGEVVLEFECKAEVVVQVGAGGVERDASAELLEGVVEVGLLEVGGAVVFAEGGGVGAELEGARVERERARGIAGLNVRERGVDEGGAVGERGIGDGEASESRCRADSVRPSWSWISRLLGLAAAASWSGARASSGRFRVSRATPRWKCAGLNPGSARVACSKSGTA